MSARGRAERRRAFSNTEHLLDFLFPGESGELPLQPNKQARQHSLRLPDELFSLIARYYWGGGLSAEEEDAAAASAAADAARIANAVAASIASEAAETPPHNST